MESPEGRAARCHEVSYYGEGSGVKGIFHWTKSVTVNWEVCEGPGTAEELGTKQGEIGLNREDLHLCINTIYWPYLSIWWIS